VLVGWDMAEELFGRDVPELVGHEEQCGPELVEVAGELAVIRRGDGPEFTICPDGNVDHDDVINRGDADFQDAGSKKLMPGELIHRLDRVGIRFAEHAPD